jgi:hypothetical protein
MLYFSSTGYPFGIPRVGIEVVEPNIPATLVACIYIHIPVLLRGPLPGVSVYGIGAAVDADEGAIG